MGTLTGKVAVVTGSSRGVGKGIALGLGEAGATVYVSGRTVEGASPDGFPGTIGETAQQVTEMGGHGIAVRCDHRNDADVEALFARVEAEQGRLHILVNNAWGGYEHMVEQTSDGVWEFTWPRPFWEQPLWRWDAAFAAGVRAAYAASRLGVPLMLAQHSGLVVNVSYWAAQKYLGNVAYGAAKAAVDKMARDMAHELQPHGVTVIALYPGLVRTEAVMNSAAYFDMSNSESPQFQGRVVAALAADPNALSKTGQVLISAALALEYGITDVDGKQPRPLTLEEG